MSDLDTRINRERKIRNPVAKVLLENKGAFAIKEINPKKEKYKRIKLRINNLDISGNEEE